MAGLLSKVLSGGADRQLKEFRKIAERVNELGPNYAREKMDDEELARQTILFRERYANGEDLDSMLPEAFAAIREMSDRTIHQRHYDVQVIGGAALHRGMIAEMKTGEGKTLVSTLAGYLNAIAGKGVHVVTVNDYLARRDSEWMGQIYQRMGLSVGLLQNGMMPNMKTPAYAADVTYGTNSEFGFDYLRDNMVTRANQRVQRGHYFAIVDEVDSILIDEARTPLIISGMGDKSATTYKDFARAVRGLIPEEDFEMDEAKHTIAATEEGLEKIERILNIDIYTDPSGQLVNHLQQALKAEYMFHRDQQYVVVDGEVKIVDEFTGRIMEGRRYSEGLHQAIEAKEGVYVREENQTLATITLQNYFRLYEKLSGMTGTAMTEDSEFREIYKLPVQAIPPNRPVARIDNDDLVYQSIDAKFNAVANEVVERHRKGQPVLVGTVSIESSERLARVLEKHGVRPGQYEVLNAKHHEREAAIVAQAGREGAITIATNMAGRGTDILLGGNASFLALDYLREDGYDLTGVSAEQLNAAITIVEQGGVFPGLGEVEEGQEPVTEQAAFEAMDRARKQCVKERENVLKAGGLCVIGTERHESRRIDNQLRGRSGRQGDPGETQFYLSLDDDLMRLFGGDRMDRIATMMAKADMPEDMPIQSKMVTKAVENAQRKVEQINFAMRKNVLDYDDVMNKQRQVIYEERNNILDGKDLTEQVASVTLDTVKHNVGLYCPETVNSDKWDLEDLHRWITELTGKEDIEEITSDLSRDQVVEKVNDFVMGCYNEKAERLSPEIMTQLTTQVMLRVIDTRWMAYLQEMDYLKTGIGLRGYGQRDPLVEYKTEAYAAFAELVSTMYEDFLRTILHIELAGGPVPTTGDSLRGARFTGPEEVDGDHSPSFMPANSTAANARPSAAMPSHAMTYRKSEDVNPYTGVGRNDPCPCGSGLKFKNCHGANGAN